MIDKSLNIFLMALLATGGIVILVMMWIMPMPLPERIVPSFVEKIMSMNIDKLNNNDYDIYHLERTMVSSRFGG